MSAFSVIHLHTSTVFFSPFAAAEPYTIVKITHGTPWWVSFLGIDKVEGSEGVKTDVPQQDKKADW